jgi:murein DD-endopeptidase MepM/ murein hydrolase activator NlpD
MLNPGAGVNAGTVGLQYLFSQLFQEDEWRRVVDVGGFEQIFSILFDNPFARQIEPLLPDGLTQPELQLPFEPESVWSFTGGPHSAWGGGTAWAALDFGPPGDAFGCVLSDEWVVASAPGIVVRAGNGEVVLDLDGDGYEQSGWVLFYMHIESRDRVSPGSYLNAGDRIGHPSCEGGLTTGTHVHIARKYNGEWISADDSIPFNLDGWISVGLGEQYDGLLVRDSVQLEACACRNDTNQISR